LISGKWSVGTIASGFKLPSTLEDIEGANFVRIQRAGAISAEKISAAGFEVFS